MCTRTAPQIVSAHSHHKTFRGLQGLQNFPAKEGHTNGQQGKACFGALARIALPCYKISHIICPSLVAVQGLTLKRHIDATLGQGKVREAVCLPPGEDLNEWLAVNTVDFYNAISVLYSTLDECCTASSCPIMSAGPKVSRACPCA